MSFHHLSSSKRLQKFDPDQAFDVAGKKRKIEARSHSKAGSMDRHLELALRDFVTFRTVSSDRSLREDCYRGAKYLCKLLVEVLGMRKLEDVHENGLDHLHCYQSRVLGMH